jgi:hypothetical protein
MTGDGLQRAPNGGDILVCVSRRERESNGRARVQGNRSKELGVEFYREMELGECRGERES